MTTLAQGDSGMESMSYHSNMVAERGAETGPCRVVADTQEALDWLDKNHFVEKDESEAEKQLEAPIGTVMMKVYQAAGSDFDGLPDMLDREHSELRGVWKDLDLHHDVAYLLQTSVLRTETQETDETGSGDVDLEVTDGLLDERMETAGLVTDPLEDDKVIFKRTLPSESWNRLTSTA